MYLKMKDPYSYSGFYLSLSHSSNVPIQNIFHYSSMLINSFLLEEMCYNDKKCRPNTGLDKHHFIGKYWYQRKFCQSYLIRHG